MPKVAASQSVNTKPQVNTARKSSSAQSKPAPKTASTKVVQKAPNPSPTVGSKIDITA